MAAVSFPNAVIDTCIPGVLMSITIPYGDIAACRGANSVVDINFKSLFKRLNGKSVKAVTSESNKTESIVPSTSSEKDASTSMDVVEVAPVSSPLASKPRNKRNDNFVDKLVRKYYCQDAMESDDENETDTSSSSESESDADSTSEAEKTGSASDSGVASNTSSLCRKKPAYVDDYYDMDDPFIDDSEAVMEIETKMKMRRVKTKKEGFFVSVGKLQVEEIHMDEDSNQGVHDDDSDGKKRRSDGGFRARWKPAEEVTAQLNQLREWFSNSKIKLFKSSQIPYNLEEHLHKLNVVVLKHHPNALEQNPSAYVDVVHDILGGEIALGKVRGALVRLAAKEKAAEKKVVLNQMINQLCNELKPLVVPCPETMQPAYKAKVAAAAAAMAAASKPPPVLGEDGTPLELPLSQPFTQPLSQLMTQEDLDVTPSQSEGKTSNAEPIHYTWYCKWNIPTRSLMLAVLQTTADWVKLENIYREKLTVHNMRMLTEEECEFLEEKDETTTVYQRISSFLPSSCYYGDVAGIRKAVAHEKSRLRTLQKKETSSVVVGSGGAVVSGESSSLPCSPIKRSISSDGLSANKKARLSTDDSEVNSLSQPYSTTVSDAQKPKKVRTPKPKATWEITPTIQHGLDQFKIIFGSTGMKLTKNSFIPHDLEASLHLLNTIVLATNPDALHMTGYVEAIHEILGGEIPAGRVKALLLRLVAKEKAAAQKEELNEMIDKLCADLKPLVVRCPDSYQPAYKAKVAATAAATATNGSSAVDTSMDFSFDGQETSRMSMDGHSQFEQPSGVDGTSETTEFIHYAWYCKWNVPTRSQLMSVIHTVGEWVKLENSHREKLLAHNIRIMTENEYCILEEKEEITAVFQRICASFPESCLNGDLTSIKRAVAAEKGRLKKLLQKEQKAVESGAATPWGSITGANTSGGNGQSSSSGGQVKSGSGNGNGSSSTKPITTANGASASSSIVLSSPVKKSIIDLTKAAKAPASAANATASAPTVSEGPKILIAPPQKMEINGRVYAAKMLAIPGISEPTRKENISSSSSAVSAISTTMNPTSNPTANPASGAAASTVASAAANTHSENSTMARVISSGSVVSHGGYWDEAELIALDKASSKPKGNADVSGTTAATAISLDEHTESFMLKYLL